MSLNESCVNRRETGRNGQILKDLGVIRNYAVSNAIFQIPKKVTQDQSPELKDYSRKNI